MLLECDLALGQDVATYLEEVEEVLLQLMQPLNLSRQDAGSAFLAVEASFEQASIRLQTKGVQNPAALTLYEFYSRVLFFTQQKSPA